jgi:hypothetical protein
LKGGKEKMTNQKMKVYVFEDHLGTAAMRYEGIARMHEVHLYLFSENFEEDIKRTKGGVVDRNAGFTGQKREVNFESVRVYPYGDLEKMGSEDHKIEIPTDADVNFIDGLDNLYDRIARNLPREKVVIASGSQEIRNLANDNGYPAIAPDTHNEDYVDPARVCEHYFDEKYG